MAEPRNVLIMGAAGRDFFNFLVRFRDDPTVRVRAFVRAGELDKPFVLLERLLHDGEFWVQRAVGTWLRECWKKDERRTAAFLRKHARGLPPVTITVATERAPKAFRQELRWSSKGKRNRRP